jgi:hypothetical protein
MTWNPSLIPANQRVWAAMPRRNDGAVFAYDVHIKFFRDMKAYLKSIGVRIPITATGRFEDLADLKSMSEELDFYRLQLLLRSSLLGAWRQGMDSALVFP